MASSVPTNDPVLVPEIAGQFVFAIPKRLRIGFRFDRRLLGELCRAAARTVITVCRAASGQPDLLARTAQASAVPGMVGAIQIPLCGTNGSTGTRISTRW